MIDEAREISGLPVQPEGSNRVWANLSTSSLSGTPCCSDSETCGKRSFDENGMMLHPRGDRGGPV